MTQDQARHISLLAAPIYAALLHKYQTHELSTEALHASRRQAVLQAMRLWRQTLEEEA